MEAIFLVSFGGPEGPDDVIPFLENVTRGRGIPRERLVEVGAHYAHFGGVSPINQQNRDLLEVLRKRLAEVSESSGESELPVYWGNRNWDPFLTDALKEMAADGVTTAYAFVTSAYSSYSGCRQYRENLWDAVEAVKAEGITAPEILKCRNYFDHPGFVEPMVDFTREALDSLGVEGARLVFTTHSIPTAASLTAGPESGRPAEGAYVAQHKAVCTLVAEALGGLEWDLVYQSRSGAPHIPWLEPDICDHLDALKEAGVPGAVIVPIGFVSDHIEVMWDLDEEALSHAAEIGLPVVRAATVGTEPRFVQLIIDLVEELRNPEAPKPSLSPLGPWRTPCQIGCCPNPRGDRPALCEAP